MTRVRSIIACLFVTTLILNGCGRKAQDDEADVKPRASVKVAPARLGNIDNLVGATGSFDVLRDERIRSTIQGKVEKVFVLEGDTVNKGSVVVSVMAQESDAAISGALQLLNQARTDAEKKQAEDALRLARLTASIANITAPFPGAIVKRFVTEGELVTQGSDLVEIVDPKTEYFVANVPINYLSALKAGERAVVTIPGMDISPLHGVVQATSPATDPSSQSVQVRIDLRHIPSLVAGGTFGNARIEIGEARSVVVVPKEAVYHDDELNRYFVWRVQGDSIALMTQVTVGLSDSADVQISSGLSPGDVVAVSGGYGLPDSTDVTVEMK